MESGKMPAKQANRVLTNTNRMVAVWGKTINIGMFSTGFAIGRMTKELSSASKKQDNGWNFSRTYRTGHARPSKPHSGLKEMRREKF